MPRYEGLSALCKRPLRLRYTVYGAADYKAPAGRYGQLRELWQGQMHALNAELEGNLPMGMDNELDAIALTKG